MVINNHTNFNAKAMPISQINYYLPHLKQYFTIITVTYAK